MRDIRKATLDATVKDGKVVGFKVDGFDNGRMDGYGYHLAVGEFVLSPAGEDAPEVFRIIEHRYFEADPSYNETIKQYIVSGEQKAIQKAYQLALDFANWGVNSRNEWIEWANRCRNLGTITGKAVLVDNAKDNIKSLTRD
jgi:hypothetical protein